MIKQFELPKAEELLAPYKTLTTLAIANTEKLVALQSKNFQKYSAVAIENFKKAAEVSDIEQAQAYFKNQAEVAQELAEGVKADTQEALELNKAYFSEVQSVFSANVEKAVEAAKNVEPLSIVKPAAPAAKKTTRKAS